MGFISNLLCQMVKEKKESGQMLELFYKALPTHNHFDRYMNDREGATDRSVIYDWWSAWLKEGVHSDFIRDTLQDALYDEHIFSLLDYIHDTFEDDIVKHYDQMRESGE